MRSLPLGALLLAGLCVMLFAQAPSVLAGSATPTEMGSGTAWLDCDNDGDLDLLYLTAFGDVLLYQYDSNADAFTDISLSALPEVTRGLDAAGMGIACGDFDDDGHVDIFLSMEGPNLLLMNNGDDTFRATTRASGITGEYLTASVGLIDFDGDGRLDLFLGNYAGGPNQLYHNDGVENGVVQFTDVAPDLGMDYAPNGGGDWTLGVAVADYDNDGDSDLYVANDYDGPNGTGLNPGPNVLWQNNGDGTFTDVSAASGANHDGWAMGVVFGDYDGDGYMDIFLANFWEDALLHNQGDGTFVDVTRDVGIITDAPDEWHHNGWGTAFLDFDNDGDLDIHVSNGYILNDQGQIVNEPNQLWENKGLDVGSGHFEFEEIGAKAGINDQGDARGAAYGDYNRDGLVDMMVINNGFLNGEGIIESPQRMLYVNQGTGIFQDKAYLYGLRSKMLDKQAPAGYRDFRDNAWVQVRPVGGAANLSAIGARVSVTVGDRTWIQDVGASSYCSANSPFLHFGLGNATTIDAVTIRFPDGTTVTETDVSVNQGITVGPQGVPVRLLGFNAVSGHDGVTVRWQWADDGDVAAFRLSRRAGNETVVVAANVIPTGGHAEVMDRGAPLDRSVEYVLDAMLRDGTVDQVGTLAFRHRLDAGPVAGLARPNPFHAATRIPVFAPSGGSIALDIFDVSGRRVRRLQEFVPAGESAISWDGLGDDGRAVSAGVYFYRLQGASPTRTLKVIRQP